MAVKDIKAFSEKTKTNPDLSAQACACQKIRELLKLAKETGFELDEVELYPPNEPQFTADQLSQKLVDALLARERLSLRDCSPPAATARRAVAFVERLLYVTLTFHEPTAPRPLHMSCPASYNYQRMGHGRIPSPLLFRRGCRKEDVMLDETVVEQRLATLECAVADLQRRLSVAQAADNWLSKITGSISDEAAFLEALEFGRAYRKAQQPPEEVDEQA